jgi:hypothetical protein
VAAATQCHVQSSWRCAVGAWTVFFTIAAAFLVTLLTIQMVPKRQRYNNYYKPTTTNNNNARQFCRTLPSGHQECLDAPPPQQRAVPEPEEPVMVKDDDVPYHEALVIDEPQQGIINEAPVVDDAQVQVVEEDVPHHREWDIDDVPQQDE